MGKGIIKRLTGLSILLSASGIAGEPSAEMTVSGVFANSRCEVIAPNNGVYDLGTISVPASTVEPRALPALTRAWRIQCDQPTTLAVIPEDNRAASANGNGHFGFGEDPHTSLGYFQLGISRAQTDQRAVMLHTEGQPISGGAVTPLLAGMRSQWVTKDNVVKPGNSFDVDITVYPWLNPQKRRVMDQVKLDGSVTLNFVFGL